MYKYDIPFPKDGNSGTDKGAARQKPRHADTHANSICRAYGSEARRNQWLKIFGCRLYESDAYRKKAARKSAEHSSGRFSGENLYKAGDSSENGFELSDASNSGLCI